MTHSLFVDEEEEKMVVVTMPYEPLVSVNHCYGITRGGQLFLKNEARLWKLLARMYFRMALESAGIEFEGDKFRVHLNARFPLKRGQKPDQTNFMKLFIDAIAEEMEIDDHNIVNGDSVASHLKENGDGVLIYTVVQL